MAWARGERLAVEPDREQELQRRGEELEHADGRIGQAARGGGEHSKGTVETSPAAISKH